MSQRIFALEGGVCAGKSTVAARLEALNVGQRVPEYMDVVTKPVAELAELAPVDRASYCTPRRLYRREQFSI